MGFRGRRKNQKNKLYTYLIFDDKIMGGESTIYYIIAVLVSIQILMEAILQLPGTRH